MEAHLERITLKSRDWLQGAGLFDRFALSLCQPLHVTGLQENPRKDFPREMC